MTRPGSQPVAWRLGRAWDLASVWPTGQQDYATQLRERGYVAETEKDHRGLPPAIAAYAVAGYSRPGALVVDPDCGAGTVVVEAMRAGRCAVGMTTSARWWRVARANITAAKQRGAWSDGAVLDASAGAARRATGLARRVDLVVTTVRLPAVVGSPGPDSDFTTRVRAWARLLRPGGHAVVVARSHRLVDGTLLDLGSKVADAAGAAGLTVVDRCVALTGQLRRGRVMVRASALERVMADRTRVMGMPVGLVAHQTALVLRAPHGDAVSEHGGVCEAGQRPLIRMVAA